MLWCLAQFNGLGGLIQVVEVSVLPVPGCPGLGTESSCRGWCCLRGAEGLPRGSILLGQHWWDTVDATVLHLASISDSRKGKNFQLFLVSLQLSVSGFLSWSFHISQVWQQQHFEIMELFRYFLTNWKWRTPLGSLGWAVLVTPRQIK